MLFMNILIKKKKRIIMFFGFISRKHLVIEFKFSEQLRHESLHTNEKLPFKDIVGFRGSSWQTFAVSLAAAVFPSVRWGFAGAWPSVDWQSFDRWWGTGCSGAGHWSLHSAAADISEACQAPAALDPCLDSAAAARKYKVKQWFGLKLGLLLLVFLLSLQMNIDTAGHGLLSVLLLH